MGNSIHPAMGGGKGTEWKTWSVVVQLETVEISGDVPGYPRRGPSPELYSAFIQEGKIKVLP